MKADLRKSGIEIIGEVPWGTHFCQFYQGNEDLIEILVPYFKQGLENNEFCMWVTSEPLGAEDAKAALKQKVKNLDEYIKKGQIEILDYSQWYTKTGRFDADKVLEGWVEKEEQAVERGFDGLRLTGDTFWLEKKDWKNFADYEAIVNSVIGKHRMLAICSYSLDKCKTSEVIDVIDNHQFALINKEGEWVSLESSERKKAEEALRETSQYLENLFNYANAPIIVWDPQFKITRFNHAFEALTGRSAHDVIGKSIEILFPADKVESSMEFIRGALEGKWLEVVEINILHLDGAVRTVLWNSATLFGLDGKTPVATIAQGQDVTERKKAQEALKDSEERLKILFESAPDAIYLNDLKGNFIDGNKTAEEMIGYKREELIGKSFLKLSLLPPTQIPKAAAALAKAALGQPVGPEEYILNRKDGGQVIIETRAFPVKIEGKTVVLGIARDITERKKTEEKLKLAYKKIQQTQQELIQASKMVAMGQLAAGISHELNQPLTGIKGFTQAVLMDLEKESPFRNDLNKIVEQADRIDAIIKNVRFFARKSDFKIIELDINQVISDSLMLLSQQLKTHNIRVIQELGSDIPKIQGDPNQLQQAFLNIINNARDAILSLNRPEGGEIRVRTALSQDKNHVEINFEDTGCGIPGENLQHIFSPFFTTKSPDRGMGLGLSITYRIIENHQGEIEFKSEAGEGTIFRIVLPLKGTKHKMESHPG